MLYDMTNPHGGDVYSRAVRLDFSVNTSPLGAPEGVRRAVTESVAMLDRYPDPNCRELAAALAAHEDVPSDYILCGNGAAELIYSFCAAIRPRCALEPAPTFSEYSAALEAVGCTVERYPLSRENDFTLNGDFLDALEQSGCGAVFLCSPNNPTGQVIDPALLADIAQVCRRRGIHLFLDECFLELSDGASLKGLLTEHPELLILKAFTKSYAMAGLRLGYCLSADRALLQTMSRTAQPWNVSLPAQMAGVAALGERDYLTRARTLIREQREWLGDRLRTLGFYVCPSRANYLLLYHPAPVAERLLDRGILVRDCANYHGLGPGWLRVAVRLPAENRALLAELRSVLEGA